MRLVNAEGDFLPGLVADRYADTVVVSLHAKGMAHYLPRIAEAFVKPSGINVYLKRDEHHARIEGLAQASGYLAGSGNGQAVISECGVKMVVDFAQGQKDRLLPRPAGEPLCLCRDRQGPQRAEFVLLHRCFLSEGSGGRGCPGGVGRELETCPGAGRRERKAQSRHSFRPSRVGAG